MTAIYCQVLKSEGHDFDVNEEEELKAGALVHDIAKSKKWIKIFRRMIVPTALTPIDRRITHKHPELGFDYITDLGAPPLTTLWSRLHHLRPDGRGYPHNLTWNIIPTSVSFAAAEVLRSLTALDVTQALLVERPYRLYRREIYRGKPLGRRLKSSEVLAILEKGRGTMFYSVAVDRMIKYWDIIDPICEKIFDLHYKNISKLEKSAVEKGVLGHLPSGSEWMPVIYPILEYAPVRYTELIAVAANSFDMVEDHMQRRLPVSYNVIEYAA